VSAPGRLSRAKCDVGSRSGSAGNRSAMGHGSVGSSESTAAPGRPFPVSVGMGVSAGGGLVGSCLAVGAGGQSAISVAALRVEGEANAVKVRL
jgi:hypothetical protein